MTMQRSAFLCCLLSNVSLALSIDISKVQAVNKLDFQPNKHYYHTHSSGALYETPILIENVLSREECEGICGTIMQELGDEYVSIQRKVRYLEDDEIQIETEIAEDTLMNAFGYMFESHHDDAFFCFCEGLLHKYEGLEKVRKILHNARESLFVNEECQDRDLFEFFPEDIRPSDCVVIAGEGATSTLHRDPYTWTGTSLCLEGRKLWRFIAPQGACKPQANDIDSRVHEIDEALGSYRLPSVAWDDDLYLSAGWQSDLSLYVSRSDDIPSAEEFASLEEHNSEKVMELMDKIALDVDRLVPSADILHWLSIRSIDDSPTIFTCIQKPGDLLIIPSSWWHQTYALQPSVAIASQRGSMSRDAKRVIEHIFDTTGLKIDKLDLPLVIQQVLNGSYTGEPETIVNALFEVLSSHT